VDLVVSYETGLVRFDYEPEEGYACPYCVREAERAAKSDRGKVAPAVAAAAAVRMHRGDVLRHCVRYHAVSPEQVVCPLCAKMPGGSASQKSVNFMEHVYRRHARSLSYGGSGCGQCPASVAAALPSVVAMGVPTLSPVSIETIVNVLGLDTCATDVKRRIVTIVQTFSVVPANRAEFLRCLMGVACGLARSSRAHVATICSELQACLASRRGSVDGPRSLPRIPSEKPQCDRSFVDVLEVRPVVVWADTCRTMLVAWLPLGVPSFCHSLGR
jgi:hypothetical protein